MNPHQTSNDTSIRALEPPSPKWEKCPSKDKKAIELYNVLVQQWNAWAKEDPAEDEENWSALVSRLKTESRHRTGAFSTTVANKAKGNGGGRATTVEDRQGKPTLNQLQQWYPRSDIMGNPRYNEDGPSFPPINAEDLIPIRGTVLQGNNQEQESNVHLENNTPQQSNTAQNSNSPSSGEDGPESFTAEELSQLFPDHHVAELLNQE
ncbi:hypothetical protein FANTH_2578 [Fusarium anthophilum]|uniref:Uncharacterized protein n=1 Tax=Fusarium anthophilum TaxID=48485 RepID=A0A8H5EA60_9HYPO|nr:hypothetical protein FANTH_2578 [Fusarium anthophilum]